MPDLSSADRHLNWLHPVDVHAWFLLVEPHMQTYTRWTVLGPVTGTSRALVVAAAEAVESGRRSQPAPVVPAQRAGAGVPVLAAA